MKVLYMNPIKNFKIMTITVALAALTACSSVPTPIDVEDNAKLVSYDKVSASVLSTDQKQMGITNLPNISGKARWGGKIVSVVNKKEVSEIEVVFFPENRFGKPLTSMPSAGRFKAIVDGFVDPLVFVQGRLITIVGEVSESQVGIIGEQNYTYPTLSAKGYYMWKETSDVNVELDTFAFSPFGYRSAFHRNFFNPWYDPWARSRIRVQKYNGHSQGGSVSGSTRAPVQKSQSTRTQVRSSDRPKDTKPVSQK
jgi:outer membrane lipoprotein